MYLSRPQKILICFYLLLAALLACALFFVREASTGIPVLSYHQISDTDDTPLAITTAEFDQQMGYLHTMGFHTITPDQLVAYLLDGEALPPKPVLITFDDGYRDNYENALPILQKYDMTAVIFLVSDFMDRFDKYLTWQQVQELADAGIQMGSHTLSHYELTALSPADLHWQLEGSRLAIEWNTLRFVQYIAYPCGSINSKVLQEVRDCGYRGGFTVHYDLVHRGDDPYQLSRVPMFGYGSRHSFLKFKLRLYGAPLWGRLERFRAELIHAGHTEVAKLIKLP